MTDLRHYDVIRTPAITEKSTFVSENNQVVFNVAKDASKLIKKYPLTSLFLGFGAGLLIARKLSR